jgi:putative oxidoreductase
MILAYKSRKHVLILCHYLIFILFLYSAFSKANKFDLFVNNLEKSPFFANTNSFYIAIIVIATEFLIPILLFSNRTTKLGYLTSFLLLFIFTGYIIMMMTLSPYLPCTCGGLLEVLSWNQHIYFNVFFMAISFMLYSFSKELE